MLPTAEDVKLSGNLTGEKIQMKLDENSLQFLQTVLTDLYSDPILAVVREYGTNAWDSHVEAGVDRPIEITTPTSLSPFYITRDYGVGLDIEDLKTIYSLYGASTKRGTNDQTGMLGLGSKSALTYTNQFTVTSVKNGMKYAILVTRDENNVGSMTVLDSSPTSDSNGVEISVPVRGGDIIQFQEKANRFFRYWDPNRVLVDGKGPERDEVIELDESISLASARGVWWSEDVVVMGGVSYPLKWSHHDVVRPSRLSYNTKLIIKAKMGDVDFTPSRESLHMTRRTINFINSQYEKVNTLIGEKINEDVADAESRADAVKALEKWDDAVDFRKADLEGMTWRGEHIPLRVPIVELYTPTASVKKFFRGDELSHHDSSFLRAVRNKTVVIVDKPEGKSLSATMRNKIKKYYSDNFSLGEYVAFCTVEEDILGEWIECLESVSWNDIYSIKLKKETTSRPKSEDGPEWDCVEVHGRNAPYAVRSTIRESELDPGRILWSEARDFPWSYSSALMKFIDGHNILSVQANRVARFKREFPDAVHLKDYFNSLADGVNSAYTNEQKVNIARSFEVGGIIDKLDPDRLDDPDLRKLAKRATLAEDAQDIRSLHSMISSIGADKGKLSWIDRFRPTRYGSETNEYKKIISKYPLIDVSYYVDHLESALEHVYLYVNTAYRNGVK